MERELAQALEGGCLGVSYGIRYFPGIDRRELERTAAVCRRQDKLIAAHLRSDAGEVMDAAREFLDVGAGFGAFYPGVPHRFHGWLWPDGRIPGTGGPPPHERPAGVSCDCYPYYAFSTALGSTTYDEGWLERYHCGYDVWS